MLLPFADVSPWTLPYVSDNGNIGQQDAQKIAFSTLLLQFSLSIRENSRKQAMDAQRFFLTFLGIV